MALPIDRFALEGGTTLYVIMLPDARAAGAPPTRFLLQNQVEAALFGGAGSGAVWRALQRLSMGGCALSLKRASVPSFVSDAAYKALVALLESTLELDARGRCRAVTLLPLPVALALAKSLGRGAATCAFLRALDHALPRAWELAAEQEANHARLEHDLVLQDALEEERRSGRRRSRPSSCTRTSRTRSARRTRRR